MNTNLQLFVSGSVKDGVRIRSEDTNLDVEVANASLRPLPESLQKQMHFTDKLLYIYTSGTTGNPSQGLRSFQITWKSSFFQAFPRLLWSNTPGSTSIAAECTTLPIWVTSRIQSFTTLCLFIIRPVGLSKVQTSNGILHLNIFFRWNRRHWLNDGIRVYRGDQEKVFSSKLLGGLLQIPMQRCTIHRGDLQVSI